MSRFPATQGWQCGAKRIEIQAARPFLLGILNVTPDSFSDGGKFTQVGAAVSHGVKLCEVADGVDVGGESTRPGAVEISAKEERARVIPVLREIRKERPEAFLSVDTYKVEVARAAVEEAGVDVVNDVGGGRWDKGMWEWVAGAGVGYVCMHAGGRPQEMQKSPSYGNVVQEVHEFLQERVGGMEESGHCGQSGGAGCGHRVREISGAQPGPVGGRLDGAGATFAVGIIAKIVSGGDGEGEGIEE